MQDAAKPQWEQFRDKSFAPGHNDKTEQDVNRQPPLLSYSGHTLYVALR